MIHSNIQRPSIALFIDAENFHPSLFELGLEQLNALGSVTDITAYADWSCSAKDWLPILRTQSIEAVQMTRCTGAGKNGADIRIALDASLAIQSEQFFAIAVMSNDSDFRPLAQYTLNKQLQFYGLGSNKASHALKTACTRYMVLDTPEMPSVKPDTPSKSADTKAIPKEKVKAIVAVYKQLMPKGGAIPTSELLEKLGGKEFYKGYATLSKMLQTPELTAHFQLTDKIRSVQGKPAPKKAPATVD